MRFFDARGRATYCGGLAGVVAALSLSGCGQSVDSDTRLTLSAHSTALNELPRDFYKPGLGDLMLTLQARHEKLWFAGDAKNWELAAFELEEIGESLDRVARWHRDNAEIPMAPSLKAFTQDARYAIDQSIRQRDPKTFVPAFDRLTQGCNACHRAAKHEFIVIRRPAGQAVGNQSFEPAAPSGEK